MEIEWVKTQDIKDGDWIVHGAFILTVLWVKPYHSQLDIGVVIKQPHDGDLVPGVHAQLHSTLSIHAHKESTWPVIQLKNGEALPHDMTLRQSATP